MWESLHRSGRWESVHGYSTNQHRSPIVITMTCNNFCVSSRNCNPPNLCSLIWYLEINTDLFAESDFNFSYFTCILHLILGTTIVPNPHDSTFHNGLLKPFISGTCITIAFREAFKPLVFVFSVSKGFNLSLPFCFTGLPKISLSLLIFSSSHSSSSSRISVVISCGYLVNIQKTWPVDIRKKNRLLRLRKTK